MEPRVSSTFVARNFSKILDRVLNGDEIFMVERRGRTVCRIEPIGSPKSTFSDFAKALATAPKPDPGFWDDVEKAIRDQTPPPDIKW